MGDNNAGSSSAFVETSNAIRELEEAKERYLACEPLIEKIQEFLKKNHGVILEEQDRKVKEAYRQIHPKIQKLENMKKDNTDNDASFDFFIEQYRETGGIPSELTVRKDELLELSSEICRQLGGVQFRIGSIVEIFPEKAQLEIFSNLLLAFAELQDVLAALLKTFRGENDGSTVPKRMNDWAEVTGTIISFLTSVLLKLPDLGIKEKTLERVNTLLDRVMLLYQPELFFGFVKVVGFTEEMAKFKEKIEDNQCQIGLLVGEIKEFAGYV